MRHLVMLSGGADSALAMKWACETGDPVVALHINFREKEGDCQTGVARWRLEQIAARKVHDYFHHFLGGIADGRCDYVEADFVTCCHMRYCDVPMLGTFAAAVCNSYRDIDTTWLGMDLAQDDGAVDAAFVTIMRAGIFPKRFPLTHIPTKHHPQPGSNWSKQAIRAALGEELWAMTISCRNPRPITADPCGACEGCKERASTHPPA